MELISVIALGLVVIASLKGEAIRKREIDCFVLLRSPRNDEKKKTLKGEVPKNR